MTGDAVTECVVSDIAAPTKNALVGGPFGSDLVSRDYVPSGIPVIRGTNLGHGRWVDGEFAYVTPQKADALASNCAKPGDVVFTQRGTLGQVALLPKNGANRYLISQSQMKLTVDAAKADALFIYYVFTSAEQQEYIRQNAIQTGVPHTNLGILRNTPLTLPPLPEQKAIAAVLGALDDKIELNRRMNATLEAMARALFQSWFVDLDPVRAKAEGRPPPASTNPPPPSSLPDSKPPNSAKSRGAGSSELWARWFPASAAERQAPKNRSFGRTAVTIGRHPKTSPPYKHRCSLILSGKSPTLVSPRFPPVSFRSELCCYLPALRLAIWRLRRFRLRSIRGL